MRLERVIHPIGQGGFYTETFVDDNGKEVFNAIYDCGSETQKPALIKKYLKEWIDRNPQRIIDAVFISHLHDDHINGLDDLLSTGRVNNLFLPQLTSEVIIEAYLYNYYKTGSLDNEGNLFISKALRNEYHIRFVQINEMDGDNNDPGDPIHINETVENSYPSGSGFFNSFVDYHGNMFRWLYIPFNSPLQSKKGRIGNDAFFSSVKDPNGQVDPQKLMELIETEGIEKCKSIYAEYFGKKRHNAYSMTLFSGLENNRSFLVDCYDAHCTRFKSCCCDCKGCLPKRGCSPNFLYTGDFEPNRKNLRKSYVELMKEHLGRLNLWDTIRRVQVPHHGSRNNFNSTLYEYACTGYISAGSKNVYGHPNADTLANIQSEGCIPIVVNEDPKSMGKEVYWI